MLKKSYLASDCIYVSIAHSEKIVDQYFNYLEPIFKKISEFEKNGDIINHLEVPTKHTTFARLN